MAPTRRDRNSVYTDRSTSISSTIEAPPPSPPEFSDPGPWQNPPVSSLSDATANCPSYPDVSPFKRHRYMRLGITQVFLGSFSMLFGIIAVFIRTFGWELCVPIWCGAFITISMVFCVVSASIALLPITIGVLAITQEMFYNPADCTIYPDYPCSSQAARITIDALIVVLAFSQIIVGLVTAALACMATCDCCKGETEYGVFSLSDTVDDNRNSYDPDNPPMLILPPSYESLVTNSDDRLILFPAVLPRPPRGSRSREGQSNHQRPSGETPVPDNLPSPATSEAMSALEAVRRVLASRQEGNENTVVTQSNDDQRLQTTEEIHDQHQSSPQTHGLNEVTEEIKLESDGNMTNLSSSSSSLTDSEQASIPRSDDGDDMDKPVEQNVESHLRKSAYDAHHSSSITAEGDAMCDSDDLSDTSGTSCQHCNEQGSTFKEEKLCDNNERDSQKSELPPPYADVLGQSSVDCQYVRVLDDRMEAFLLEEEEV
ncbi:uncharacterized protein [Ptychodera flava]|uniref:uncharacterized protein isoform X2 n=1 Tax=Ptychodera flava TaxID=63121 RepID=UPI00396A910E